MMYWKLAAGLCWSLAWFASDARAQAPSIAGDCAAAEVGSRLWVRGEYLLWWTNDGDVPPLVSASPQASLGILGQPGTRVLFGGPDSGLDYGARSGGRFGATYWLDSCQTCAIEGNFFFLCEGSTDFAAFSHGDPVLARPFFNVLRGVQDAEQVANLLVPGRPDLLPLAGGVSVSSQSRLWGAELDGRANVWQCCNSRFDLLAGFRYLSLDEGLTITENLRVPDSSAFFPGSRIDLVDDFQTRNDFYGGQLGAQVQVGRGRWIMELTGKIGLGSVRQQVAIAGVTRLDDPTLTPVVAPGGLLALPSNIGVYHRDRFAVLPEVGVNVGYQVSRNLIARVGYNFLYLSNVARPSDQIDIGVNPSQLPPGRLVGPARPAFQFQDTDFWAQGINFALEFRY